MQKYTKRYIGGDELFATKQGNMGGRVLVSFKYTLESITSVCRRVFHGEEWANFKRCLMNL